MDRYVYIKSDDSNSYFSNNKVFRFKVHFKLPLLLHGFWKVGLTELHVKVDKQMLLPKKSVDEALYVFTNICKESIVNCEEQPLLRRLEPTSKQGWNYMFDTVIYLPVKRKEILEFEVYIKGEDGTFASFLKSPLHMTLHFKQYPFYNDYESL